MVCLSVTEKILKDNMLTFTELAGEVERGPRSSPVKHLSTLTVNRITNCSWVELPKEAYCKKHLMMSWFLTSEFQQWWAEALKWLLIIMHVNGPLFSLNHIVIHLDLYAYFIQVWLSHLHVREGWAIGLGGGLVLCWRPLLCCHYCPWDLCVVCVVHHLLAFGGCNWCRIFLDEVVI